MTSTTNEVQIKPSKLNRLNKNNLQVLMGKISNEVAEVISSTYGPYGKNTLIQSVDTIYATKDGWTVLQNLNYPNNGVYNALKKLIMDCAQSVLLKIGDGTTTVTLLANEMYSRICDEILNSEENYTIKELENTLESIVDSICTKIADAAKPISSNDGDVIRNIAAVSTNWDMEMAGFISDIYKNTGNPIIKFENSGSDKSYVEYISGYDIKGQLMLPDFYITDHTTGKCEIENPAVLMFNYPIGAEMLHILNLVANTFASRDKRTLVVVAPDFVPDFINGLKSVNMTRIRQGMGALTCVPFKYYTNLKVDKDCADDLCYLFGTDMISRENTDMTEMFTDIENALRDKKRLESMENPSEEDIIMVNTRASDLIDAAHQYLLEICGTCSHVTMTDKYILAKDFTNANTKVIDQRKETLKHEIDLKTKECAALSMITEGIRLKRVRLGKLQLNMGVIYVGGFGDANLKAKRDALDDATKACEAAYQSGYYTVGGGISPMIACKVLRDNDDLTPLGGKLTDIIFYSYSQLLHIMYNNKFEGEKSPEEIGNIISGSLTSETAYNLITEEYDPKIVTPVSGEIEILKGSMNLVIAMMGANQMIFHDINSIDDVKRIAATEECGDVSFETQVALLKN